MMVSKDYSGITFVGYLFIQCGILLMPYFYPQVLSAPWYVIWAPTLIIGVLIAIPIALVLIAAVIGAIIVAGIMIADYMEWR